MPNDGYTLFAVKNELDKLLTGGKVAKVLQPEPDEIALIVHNNRENYRLLLSASPVSPRAHLTWHAKENPPAPPPFCMTLRKHLTGSTVSGFEQENLDRVLRIRFLGQSELYDPETKSLIVEIMGKHSNLILVGGDNRILGAARSVSLDVSSVRQVLPGLPYAPAKPQDKVSLADCEGLSARLKEMRGELSRGLADAVSGLSRTTAAEIAYCAGDPNLPLAPAQLENVCDIARRFYRAAQSLDISPCVTLSPEGAPLDFFLFPYKTQPGKIREYATINAAIDDCYYLKDKRQRFTDRARSMSAALKSAISRAERKLGGCLTAIEQNRDFDSLRVAGELITANLYRMKAGEEKLIAENYYYDPPRTEEIPLNAGLTPPQNAQRYYKKYGKSKRAFEYNRDEAERVRRHLDYLYGVQESFENCTETAELADLRRELELAGILKPAASKRREREAPSLPLHTSKDGFDIFVGKNNLQNDRLTKEARPQDVWLHACKIHGSHVVIANPSGGTVPDGVLERGAELAAFYSKARSSSKVPVDYTLKKYVKKPPQSPPGYVTYTNQRTIFVTPRLE